jgi:hypothetical protein
MSEVKKVIINWSTSVKFLLLMLTSYGICIPLLIFLPSYFDFDASESLSIYVQDGWCNSGQGIGLHCFGDFFYTFKYTDLIDPWSHGMNPQPPLGTSLYRLFSWYTVPNPNSQIPLLVYLSACLAAALFPAWHYGWKRFRSLFLTLGLSIATITFAPILMGLDRGSNQLLMIPFVYLFVVSIVSGQTKRVLIYGLVLVLIKPQMILLGLVFILNRDLRNSIRWGILSILVTLASFLLYPFAYTKNIKDYFVQMIDYQHYVPAGLIYPVNISISNLWSTFHRIYFEIFPSADHYDNPESWQFYSPVVTLLLLFLIAIFSWKFGPGKSNLTQAVLAVSLPALIPNVSFHYYYCVFFTPYLFLISRGLRDIIHGEEETEFEKRLNINGFVGHGLRKYLLASSAIALFIPWPLPWVLFSSKLPFLISASWLVGQVLITLAVFVLIFSVKPEHINSEGKSI